MQEKDKSAPRGEETKSAKVPSGLGTAKPEEMDEPFPGASTTGKGKREYVEASSEKGSAGADWPAREAKASDHSTKTVGAEPGKGGKRREDEK